jgi:hypothetical protein
MANYAFPVANFINFLYILAPNKTNDLSYQHNTAMLVNKLEKSTQPIVMCVK